MRTKVLSEMMKSGRYFDMLALARYFYRIGQPLIGDASYERFCSKLRAMYPETMKVWDSRSYDDDTIPFALLKEIGVEPVEIGGSRSELVRYLDEEKSRSIETVTGYRDAYNVFQEYRKEGKDIVLSLKVDGVNTKNLFLEGRYRLGMSRGRSGNGFDWTDGLRRIMPSSISQVGEIRVVGECFVESDRLAGLRAKYGDDKYKTPKSAAISLLRVKHEVEDYQGLRLLCFGADGVGSTLSETFRWLERNGFSVVPYRCVRAEDIPADFSVFKIWLKGFMDVIAEEGKGMPSDGMVAEVDDLDWAGQERGQYQSRQIALKFEYWSYRYYVGKVMDVVWEQKRVTASVRVRIECMTTADGCTAKIINVFNPSMVLRCGLKRGAEVYFERNSGAVNILLYGERLKKILEDGDENGVKVCEGY